MCFLIALREVRAEGFRRGALEVDVCNGVMVPLLFSFMVLFSVEGIEEQEGTLDELFMSTTSVKDGCSMILALCRMQRL
jgi:hypothetical protein